MMDVLALTLQLGCFELLASRNGRQARPELGLLRQSESALPKCFVF